MDKSKIKKIVLAYSGGLDTSIIIPWLKENYNDPEIIAVAADVGQGDELDGLEEKAIKTGASKLIIADLTDEMCDEIIVPSVMMDAKYEKYLLGTAFARPVIGKKLAEIALAEGADAIAHGATGKGNDQCRFEISYAALAPDIQVISPWRIDEFRKAFPGRTEMIEYCKSHNINVQASAKKPYSMDRNMLHISYEAGILEDPWFDPTVPENKDMFKTTVSPEDAPDKPTYLELTFEKGDCVAIDGKAMKPSDILRALNKIGGENGIGRVDIVENRFVGMKSRGVYETPGGTILEFAHRNMETITMDRELMHLRDSLIPKYAELIYNGFWYAPEREALQAFVDKSQEKVSGVVRVKLYKGNIACVGRKSPFSLYDENIASMEGVKSDYNQDDATGFIRLQSLRLKERARKQGVPEEAFAKKSNLVRE